jgi:hypothetical protein
MNRRAIAQFTHFTAISSHSSTPSKAGLETARAISSAPGTANIDFSPFKDFKTERFDVRVRTEFFSVLNHPQFGFPDTNVNNSTFGVISAINPKEDAATKGLKELLHSHPELPDLQPEWILVAKAAGKEIEDRAASGAGDAQAQCLGCRNSATDGKRRD